MSDTIQIPAGDDAFIHAVYSKPEEEDPDNPCRLLIITLHGFPGSRKSHDDVFGHFESLTINKDFHSLHFDYRGCGESDGQQEDFTLKSASEDIQSVLKWAKELDYQRFIFVGEGLGAALTLMNLEEETACVILLWPMLDLPNIAKNIFKADEIEEAWEKTGYALIDDNRIGLEFIKELQKTKMAKFVKTLDKATLIMHGARDEVSPITQLDMVRKYASARRVEITSFQDGTHGLPDEKHRKMMFYHIMQFIEKYA